MLEIRVADGGTSSETTNRIAGVLREEGSAPAARTVVRLVKSGFNPLADSLPGSLMDTTDGNGRYGFRDPVPGAYRLEAADAAKGLYGLQAEIRYAGGNLKVPDLNLGPPAFLAIVLPDSLRTAGGYVFIPGSTFRKGIGEGRASLLGPLPAMLIPALAYSRDSGGPWKILVRNIRLQSGDTTKIRMQPSDTGTIPPYAARTWKAQLNTTVAGAAVGEDVIGFPLLVRLDSANFDFTSVPENGAGIGFFKPDGTPLPFEIERWDRIGRRAELWVRADTLKGNSDSRFLELRYSPEAQAAASDGPSVFGPADGFVGVWHLGGAPGDRPDATGNGHWAKPVYATGKETSEGQVGRADSLGIINNYLDVGIVNLGNSFTLSAWVRPDTGSYWSAVVQKAASAYDSISDTAIAPWRLSYGLLQYGAGDSVGSTVSNGTDYPVLTASAGAGPWSLLTAAFDGDRLVLYRDGNRIASNQPEIAGSLKQNEISTRIGGYTLPRSIANGSLFSGLVDEVRIEKLARSEAWIKLCHENQKTGQTLIRLVR